MQSEQLAAAATDAELLSPAGSLEKLKVAFKYGADAVYLGGKAFNLRARSSNFSFADLEEGVAYAHAIGKRVYVAVNILAHDREIRALPAFLKRLDALKVDAVIVSDLGVMELVSELTALPIHVSTQASCTNWRAARQYQRLGAKRIVLAREVALDEVRRIKDALPELELEVFVHGAMCMTYSGRCNLSNYFSSRDGNRGACSNTCRWQYSVVEEKRPGEYFPVYEDDTGTYMYNSKDLCTLPFLDKILAAGVSGLKIEGRMKGLLYLATTTRAYALAREACRSGDYQPDPQWLADLQSYSHRDYTTGFYLGKLDRDSEQVSGGYRYTHKYIGRIRRISAGEYETTIHEKCRPEDAFEAMRADGSAVTFSMQGAADARTGQGLEVLQPNHVVRFASAEPLEDLDVVRLAVGERVRPAQPAAAIATANV